MVILGVTQDERCGLPSASSMERILLCSGSFQMEKRLKDTGPQAAAQRGTRIHEALEGKIPMMALNHSDRICAERMAHEEARIVEHCSMEGAEQLREIRFWVEGNGRKIFSAKPDIFYWDAATRIGLVANYKTGHYAPTPAKENAQMASEAVAGAAQKNFQVEAITAVLIHPNAPLADGAISQGHTFKQEELYQQAANLTSAALQAIRPDAKRTPSKEACRWCRGAKSRVCPEFLESQA